MREMRSLLLALRPVALEEADLTRAIEAVCHSYSERLEIPVRSEVDLAGPGPAGLPPALEHAVLRVTQEAVANAARHAEPGHVTVLLQPAGAIVVLEIADDGRGFDVTWPQHAVLRVTQEAVANAARHEEPGQLTVLLRTDSRHVLLEIADDGRGFDVTWPQNPGGLGLRTMRDRVTELGGQLTIDSVPGAGTRVRASFPLREA